MKVVRIMRKSLLPLAVATALMGATAAQAGGDDPGATIIGAQAFHLFPDNGWGIKEGDGARLSLGRVLSDEWNFNVNLFASRHRPKFGGKKDTLAGVDIDWDRVFNRHGSTKPLLNIGLGYADGVDPWGNSLSFGQSLFAKGGAGFIGDLATFGNDSKLQLRADAGVRYFLAKSYLDPYVGLGLQVAFGGTRPAAPVAAPPPPPPPPPAAAPPPPPPPPPPADSDNDGVPDNIDRCPQTPPGDAVDAVGCSLTVRLEVLFDFDSTNIKSGEQADLDRVVEFFSTTVPTARGVVEGHTDSTGPEAYNLALSQRRADAVKKYLTDRGVDDSRIESVGYGESQPEASNATAEGRAQNRRVVLRRTDSR